MGLARAIGVAWVVLALTLGSAPALAASTTNLLRGARIAETSGVKRAPLVNDGVAAPEGDGWDTTITARFADAKAYVVYDLGAPRTIDALWIQADANDDYVVEASLDDVRFTPAWRAEPASGAFLRARWAKGLVVRARYLRLRAQGGDGQFGVSELQAFERAPARFPPDIPTVTGVPIARNAHNAALYFGLALFAFVGLSMRHYPWWWTAVLALLPLGAGVALVRAVPYDFPLEPGLVSLLRGTVALAAAFAVAREAFAPARYAPDGRAVVATLALCGVASFACFYNLGVAQFWNDAEQRPTLVHYLDLRQYYTTAKYFDELGYRHIYEADIAEYLEDGDVREDQIADTPMRDLDTHEIRTVGQLRSKIAAVKARFSPERWEEFKKDERFFRETMGTRQWLIYLIDYGGNATPVWITQAHALFGLGPASDAFFMWTGLLDPLLLLGMFFAIGWTFGARTAFVCMVLFGANDFIMYGSNWAGATLRHDWLAYLGLGACALRRGRLLLGGALFGVAATIRAFPGVALIGVLIPAGALLVEDGVRRRVVPSLAVVLREGRSALRVLIGGAASLGVLVAISFAVVPPAAWVDWSRKVALLSADVHPTHVGLRAVIGGWENDQGEVLRERRLLFVVALVALLALVVLACRRRGLAQASMIALLIVPAAMYPANYYLHLLFLWPIGATVALRGEEEEAGAASIRAKAWIVLLLMCFAQYFATLETNYGPHFFMESSMLLAAMFAFLWLLASSPPPAATPARAIDAPA